MYERNGAMPPAGKKTPHREEKAEEVPRRKGNQSGEGTRKSATHEIERLYILSPKKTGARVSRSRQENPLLPQRSWERGGTPEREGKMAL